MNQQTRQLRRFEDLPEVMTPRDLMHYLPIGRNGVYGAINDGQIRSIRVGQKFLVTKDALRDFLGSSGIATVPGPTEAK